MALVNDCHLHYTDKKKSKKTFLKTVVQILKQFRRNVPWVTLFKQCLRNFDLSVNVALVNGVYLHFTDIKKFFFTGDKTKLM